MMSMTMRNNASIIYDTIYIIWLGRNKPVDSKEKRQDKNDEEFSEKYCVVPACEKECVNLGFKRLLPSYLLSDYY